MIQQNRSDLPLLIDGTVIMVSPKKITAVLEENREENETVTISCTVHELLGLILEIEKYAIESHVGSSIEVR